MAPAAQCRDLARRLLERAREAGGGLIGHLAAEIGRVEAGVPRFGADITQTNIPQETGQLRGLSFHKGCYPGQEIVERVRSRGHVNRQLVGLMAKGAARLEPGSAVTAEGQTAGRVMTAVYSPGLRRSIALAYVRRDYTEPGTTVETAQGQAEVTALPFPRFK
jgi:folate-binding protein YgfZ